MEYYTVSTGVENVSESREYEKVYCVLANLSLVPEFYERLCLQVLPVLNEANICETAVVYSMLSRKDDLLDRFLEYQQKLKLCDNPKIYMFNHLTLNSQNVLHEFMTLKDHKSYQHHDHELSQYARVIKLIDAFNSQTEEDIDLKSFLNWIEPLLQEIDDPKKNKMIKLYLLEMKREQLLIKFLQNNSSVKLVNVFHISRQRKILYELLDNVNISYKMYERLKPIVISHHNLMSLMLEEYNPFQIVPKKDELEFFSIILCTKIQLDLMLLDESQENYQQVLDKNITQIKEISKNIKEMSKQLRFCEILFATLFVRFEDLIENPLQSQLICFNRETIVESSNFEQKYQIKKSNRQSINTEFMACESFIRAILNFIKVYLLRIKRSHAYIEETEANINWHMKILDNTNDALYRLSIITKCISQFIGGSFRIHTIHLDSLIKPHQIINEHDLSTDEEEIGYKFHVSRRRIKRLRKSKVSVDSERTSYSTTNGSENVLLDMKCSYSSERGRPRKMLNKMLSNPDTLATLCAIRGDTIELKNVIKKYDLFGTPADHYVCYMEKFEEQKLIISNALKNKNMDFQNNYENEFEASKIVTFGSAAPIVQRQEELDILEKHKSTYKFLHQYEIDGIKIVSLLDLNISLPCTFSQNRFIYTHVSRNFDRIQNISRNELQSHGYVPYCYNLIEYLESYKHVYSNKEITIQEFLTKEFYPLKEKEITNRIAKIELFMKLKKNALSSFASVEALEDKCYQIFETFKFDVSYFQRLISYLNTAKKLLDFHSNEFDFSPDALLMLNLDTVIGEIVNIEKVPPTEIEELVVGLGKSLVHVLINYNLCPIVTQTSMTDLEEHALLGYLDSCLKTEVCDIAKYHSNDSCLKMESSYLLPFIERSNLMAAQLIRELHGISTDKDLNFNMSIIRDLAILPQIQILSKLFNNNCIMTVLNYDNIDLRLLHKYLISTTNFKEGIHSIESIKEIQYKRHQIYFEKIKDVFLARLIDASDDEDDYWYLCKIVNFNLKSEYVNKHLHKIKDNVLAKRLLKDLLSESHDKCLRPSYIAQIKNWIIEVEVYEQIAMILGDVNWLDIRQKSFNETDLMLQEILDSNELYNVLPKWIELHPLHKISDSNMIENIKRSFEMSILKNNNDKTFKILFGAIDSMKAENVIELYETLIAEVDTLKTLKLVVDYLQRTSRKKERYQKYQISIRIFECLNELERQNLWNLKTFPLLILEQFLMNTRFEILTKVLSAIKPLLYEKTCRLCHDNHESDYSNGSMSITNLTHLVDISNSGSSDYIMINYDTNHIGEFITVDCVNVMLRLYASKALDIRISERYSAASYSILSRVSIESSRSPNVHQMPKEAPPKESWVTDEDAGICMSCNKAIFTLLTRRHHCRRCGKVVCHTCSTKRVKIPELYGDVLVRACNNCFYQMEIEKETKQTSSINDYSIDNQWQLTGSEKHDNVVREEFSYEYAPNVNLCLSICDLYLSDHECAQFLLHHASKLEALFRPVEPGHANPEMDYELVGKMIHCLALAAKVRGASDECNEIIAHSDIMQALVENKCESLMPMEPINLHSIRKLRDALIRAEQWRLALEISLKYNFSTLGVMASWGIICLKAGSFMTAREKFAHCFKIVDVSTDRQRSLFSVVLSDEQITAKQVQEWEQIKRPIQTSGLLNEILSILENSYYPSLVRSVTNNKSSLKENLDGTEPAYNFTSRLKNLKNITQNIFEDVVPERKMFRETRALPKDAKGFMYKNQIMRCKYFEESIFYLNSYGTHLDIIDYLIKHHQIVSALRYILIQKIEPDTFVHRIYYPCLRQNNVDIIFDYMMDLDETLILWKNYILHLCRHLEKRASWKELYDIQVLIKDPIRASMTCIKFYNMNCKSYRDLMNNRQQLIKAQRHLEQEFELASHWENIKTCKVEKTNSLIMKRDMKTLSCLLNLISMQLDTAAFLAQCELDGYDVCEYISKICADAKTKLPTLFDSSREKLILAVLIIVLGKTIDAGFTLSFRIIVEFNLDATQVYGISAKFLAANDRIKDISSLIRCIHSKDTLQSNLTALSDEILCLAVKTGFQHYGNNKKNELVALISDVKDIGTKIMCYIYTNQLKSAYLLAVKNDRINDIKKILRKAELIDQKQVKKLCEKKLLLSKIDNTNNV
ncbi:zinc finger FYVE domain-containing protein 26 homolog [Culicoides brevitarsis]|uniref:zinc finger FYVE domain-containing protein 26 homolog n=1 Tax=Culicoides brevitarsis TaxID=469753 RepID=UPI00307BDE87